MVIKECIFLTHIEDNYTYIRVKYNSEFEEVLRVVSKKELFVKPSDFVGLKREEGIKLDTTIINRNINIAELF